MDFWFKTSGTWINIFTVAIGTTLGLTLKNRLTQKMQLIITQGIGLITIWIGLGMANTMTQVKIGGIEGAILGLLAIVIGGILGEWWQIEEKLTGIGNWLKQRFRGRGRFTEGFVASSLLFCVGPMTLLGSLNNGLTGDNTILLLKATMDGIVSIALANIYGLGVGFSILVLLFYQGGLSLAAAVVANFVPDPTSDPHILLATGVGGITIIAIGLNLLEIVKVRVASLLPSIFISPLIFYLASIIAQNLV